MSEHIHNATQHNQTEQPLDTLTFEERIQRGATNAIHCMGVTAQDRVFIICLRTVGNPCHSCMERNAALPFLPLAKPLLTLCLYLGSL